MPGDRRQILSLLRLPIPPLQRYGDYQFSMRHHFPQLCCCNFVVAIPKLVKPVYTSRQRGFPTVGSGNNRAAPHGTRVLLRSYVRYPTIGTVECGAIASLEMLAAEWTKAG